jgi:group I intron endonuclease
MRICTALLKYGYSNFSLEILEYCEVSELLIREGYYQQKLNPEYNTAKEPGAPMLGRTHSDESRQKISDTAKKIDHSGRFQPGENNLNFGIKLSDETRAKISLSMPNSIKIEVTDMPSFALEQGQK